MAVKVIRKFRNLFDVTFGSPADGDVATYDQATDKVIMAAPTGGGGGVSDHGALTGLADDDHTQYVHTAPASSARNVIVPADGAVIAAVIKAHAAQSVDLLQFQDSSDAPFLSVGATGKVGQGARAGNALHWVDLWPTLVPVADIDGFGLAANFGMGLRLQALAGDPVADSSDLYYGMQAVIKTPANDKRHGTAIGVDAGAIFRGTKVGGLSQGSVYGGRLTAQDFDYGVGGGLATGMITLLTGSESIAVHASASPITSLIGQTVYADCENLIGVAPGPVGFQVAGQTVDVFVGDDFGTLPRLYGSIFSRSHFVDTVVTDAAGLLVNNFGQAGTVTSYGLRIEGQSGSTTNYGLAVLGGKSLFTDGLVIALLAAPADAAYANGEGGWWWDQANSLPKWKGKTSGGVVVNFTPADAQALSDHLADTADAHDASAISVLDTNGDYTATTVEGVLAEIAPQLGGGGGALSVAQTAHGLAVGDVVRLSGANTYTKAKADSEANAEVAGIVSAVADANTFTLTTNGDVTGLTGLTAATVYYLSESSAGALTATEPSTAGQVSKPVLISRSTTAGLFFNMRGAVLAGSLVKRYPIQLLNPRSSSLAGNSFFTVLGLTDWDAGHWEFLKDVDGKVYGQVAVPASYVAGGTIRLALAANATSGVTRVGVGTKAVADGESVNPGALTDETKQDITVPGTAYLRKDVTFVLTEALAASDLLIVELFHEGSHANDTLAVNTLLLGAWLEVAATV